MLVLLLMTDAARRHAIRLALGDAALGVDFIEADDGIASMFNVAPHRVDLVVTDPALRERYGNAWLTGWRRMVPSGALLTLREGHESDVGMVRKAIQDLRESRLP